MSAQTTHFADDATLARISQLERENRELAAALRAMLDRYVSLVECGDCGNWDAEKEPQVIAARAALAKVQP